MNEIVELDTSLIVAEQNNREDFSHVPGLAESIRTRGQDQPITVVHKADGRYLLIAGESRTRACAMLGIKVKAIVREDLTPAGGYMLTLVENDGRQETNDLEKAKGYQRAIAEHGYTVDEIAKHTGKKVDYVQRRLNLLRLREDIQKLVKDGQLGIAYANLMIDLDANRQLIAMRQLRDNPSPTVKWFALVCGELLQQQQQQGLFGWGYGDNETAVSPPAAPKMPADPAGYKPSFNPGDMRGSILAEMEKWRAAGEEWARYGKGNKVELCQNIVAMAGAFLSSLPAVSSPPAGDNEAERVLSVIRDRGKGGDVTTRTIYHFANFDRKEEIRPVLERMERDGRIVSRISGRGERWAIVQ
jgi:ParB/RepB/Spo0J family partition protein